MIKRCMQYVSMAVLALASLGLVSFPDLVRAEDTDIFTVNPNIAALRPNVLIVQDNSANWNTPFAAEKAALVSTVNGLDSRFNVGLMSFVETGGGNSNVDGSYMRAAIRQMTSANKAALSGLVNAFDQTADKSNNAVYGLTMAEAYRYFGGRNATTGQVKRDAAGNSVSSGSSATASNAVFALPGNAFTSTSSNTYVSPISDGCAKNFIIFISNGPANDDTNGTRMATTALQGYGGSTTPITLSPNGSQSNVADEWARFMANSDVNPTVALTQNVYVYTVDVNPDTTGQGPGHTALLKSMALRGKGKYFAVTSNTSDIADALNKIFQEVLAVNSVFASATLPVAANVRGSLLNQIYMGVFRPDGQALPRWTGNLKQFAAAPNSAGNLELVDRNSDAVENAATGFIKNNVTSFWSVGSSYWDSAYYPDAQGIGGVSDAPDGDLVEKGGTAQRLRGTYATSLTNRTLYTCLTGTCTAGTTFSASINHSFSTLNPTLTVLPETAFGISGISTVSSLTRSGTTATATTSAAHGYSTGQSVTISGASQSEYNGLFTVTVTSATQFTFTVVENPTSPATGLITLSRPATQFSVTSLTRAAASSDASTGSTDIATAVTSAAHGYAVNATVTISGANQAEYNGAHTVLAVPNTTSFTYRIPVNPVTPALAAGTATVSGVSAQTLSSLTRTGRTVTGTTKANKHGFGASGSVTIAGANPTEYNGTFAFTSAANSTFTYTLQSLATSTSATGAIMVGAAVAPVTLTSLTRATGSNFAQGTTSAAHGLSVGNTIIISGATQSPYNGTFTVAAVPTATTFTYAVVVSPTSPATGTITSAVSGTTSKSDLINWVRGENRQNADNPSTDAAANTYVRGYLHGDVVHSRPAIINYNRSGQPADRDIAVFYGSNDGIFHAVKGGQDNADGGELWGFVPSEFFSQLGRQYSASPVINNSSATTAKPYFADGPISTLLIDASPADSRIDYATTGDMANIYISMRRGGRFLYALDVTNAASPKLLWKLSNSTAGMAELGQTWAEAKVAKIAGYANNVLILSAGYDAAANDAATQGTATMGRGFYIIDAITGTPLWFAGAPAAATAAAAAGLTSKSVSGMVYAIAGDASPIDSDGDGVIDRVYLADTGGNIWRANISAVTSGGAPDYANWTVSKIASLGGSGSNARKFLFGPDVVRFDGPPTTTDSILIGSGDREQPFDVSITNKFYMIKDSHLLNAVPTSAFSESDLCDLTDDNLQGADAVLKQASLDCIAISNTAKHGWYITLGTGEKVVTNSVTLNSLTVFGTNVPESTLSTSDRTTCSSGLGEARLYAVNFKDATSLIDQQADGLLGLGDRYLVNKGGGLPPSPTAISTNIGGRTYEGIGSGTTIITPPGAVLGRRTRLFWSIRNEVE